VRLAAAALVVLLAAPSSAVAGRQRTVALQLRVTGVGTVHVTGNGSFACRRTSCRHTVRVPAGRRITLRAAPAAGWKLTKWGGACGGTAASCSLQPRDSTRVSVRFVPPGARSNPYPLGTAVKLDGAWRLTVNSATLDADSQVAALNPPPPAGAQYALVNVSLTYVGTGFRNVFGYVDNWLGVEGAGKAEYRISCTPPPLDLSAVTDPVYPGQTVTGNLCFEIASSDASTLLLFGTATTPADSYKTVYFALR